MTLLEKLIPRARKASKRLVLPEGQDPRVAEAALKLARDGICTPIVIASPEELENSCRSAGVDFSGSDIEVIDPENYKSSITLAEALYERRKHKGMTLEDAQETIRSQRLYLGNMLVRTGMADGLVAGSISSTSNMLRAAFHCIGTADGIKLGSSCFLMDLAHTSPGGNDVLIFADCGVNPNPTAEQLVDIARATASNGKALLQSQPRIAFLSFSTKGSSDHPLVDKMQMATSLTQASLPSWDIDAVVDGELQADAAIVPAVAASKCPESNIQGDANILIFPDLQSGNIAYKLTQRLAGAKAYGPILQGLDCPVNDLSRGCSADDIFGVGVITVCQAIG